MHEEAINAALDAPHNKINRRIYRDESIYQAEMQRLFKRSWIYVCHESEVPEPGTFKAAQVGDQPIIVARGKDGVIRAFYNSCSHRGATLVMEGACGKGGRLLCPYHNWTFDLSGKCVGIPGRAAYGAGAGIRQFDIPAVRAESFYGLIFAAIDPITDSLEEFLGDVAPHLRDFSYDGRGEVIGKVRHYYDGNWKLWHENFTDGYHPTFTHRLVADYEADYPGTGGQNAHLNEGHSLLSWKANAPVWERFSTSMGKFSGYTHDATQSPGNGRPDCERPGGLQTHMNILSVFPNLDVQPAGGSTVLEIVHPVSPTRSILELIVIGVKGEPPEHREWRLRRVAPWHGAMGKIAADDVEAVERCQQGFAAQKLPFSDMSRGIEQPGDVGQSPQDEHGLRGFYRAWKRYMAVEV